MSETTQRERRNGFFNRKSSTSSSSSTINTIGCLGYTHIEGPAVSGKNMAAMAQSIGLSDGLSVDGIQKSGCQYATIHLQSATVAYGPNGASAPIPAGTDILTLFPKSADGKNRTPANFFNTAGSQKPMLDSVYAEDPANPNSSIRVQDGSNIKLEQLSLHVDKDGKVFGICKRAFAGLLPEEKMKPAIEDIAKYGEILTATPQDEPEPTVGELEAAGVKMIKTGHLETGSYVSIGEATKPNRDGKQSQYINLVSKDPAKQTTIESLDDLKSAITKTIADRQANPFSAPEGQLMLKAVLAYKSDDPNDSFSRVPMDIPTNVPQTDKDAPFYQATADEVIKHIMSDDKSLQGEFVTALSKGEVHGVAVQCRYAPLMGSLTPSGDHGIDMFMFPYEAPEGFDKKEGSIGFVDGVAVETSSYRNGYTYEADPKTGEYVSKEVKVTAAGCMLARNGFLPNPPTYQTKEGETRIGISDNKAYASSVMFPGDSFKDIGVLKETLKYIQENVVGGESPEQLHKIRAEATKHAMTTVKPVAVPEAPPVHMSDLPFAKLPEVMLAATQKTYNDLTAGFNAWRASLEDEINKLAPYMRPEQPARGNGRGGPSR